MKLSTHRVYQRREEYGKSDAPTPPQPANAADVEAAAGTNPLDPLSNPAPWIEENAFGAIIAWNAQLQQTYCVEVCGIDPVTHAFIDWHSVNAETSCGIASVFAPIGSDGTQQKVSKALHKKIITRKCHDAK